MKPRGSNKTLVRLASVGFLIVLAGVLVYLSMAGRAPRALTRPGAPHVATPVRPAPVPPPTTSPATPPAGPSRAGGPAPAGMAPRAAGTPPVAGTAAPSGAPAMGGPPKATPPAQAPPGKPPSGTAGAPINVASTEVNPNSEATLVGKGPEGRSDPFSPLATQESGGPSPLLPPPPGVGLPVPPGFAAPGGGPGTLGMRVAGIMGGRSRVAIIEASDGKSYIVRAGERVGDAVIISVLPDKVVIKQNNQTFELSFGGAS